MKKENVITSCYSLLRHVTPLEYDCGKVCDGKCCKGDGKTGMLLFPGEENLIDPEIKIMKNENGDNIAVCNGTCDRDKRPLSCRIYPLFPGVKLNENEVRIEVVFDPRADCPLTNGEYGITRRFSRYVKRVGKYLLLNGETKRFYLELSDEIQEYIVLKKFLKK